jgi:dihydropteroate synthase
MGILNVTPDSFSDGGEYSDLHDAVERGLELERDGADILDIGGESTRPGAQPVEAEEELERTIPVIEALRGRGLEIPISIDSYKAAVAYRALRAGAEIINDVSGLRYDAAMAETAAREHAGLILMHLRGSPRTMQEIPPVKNILPAVRNGLETSLRRALAKGVQRRGIVMDPGIGFGKTAQQNYELIAHLPRIARLGYPILVGPSRKSFQKSALENAGGRNKRIRNAMPTSSQNTLTRTATAAALTASVLRGAHIVRVHDVKQMLPAICCADLLLDSLQH